MKYFGLKYFAAEYFACAVLYSRIVCTKLAGYGVFRAAMLCLLFAMANVL